MAKRKSTAEELLDLISEICFYLPVWRPLKEHPKGSNAKYKDLTNYFEKMPPTPKTLQVFLPEGTPAGILIA
jgi:hypothetical protein